jgi:hypothetical protein
MNTTRTVVVLSRRADGLAADLRAAGLEVLVVDEIAHWEMFHRPVASISFLFDGLSMPADVVERLAIALHSQRPEPDAVVIVPPTDPERLGRFEEAHLWVHRHGRDDWNLSRAHLAGQRGGEHVHAV